MVVLFSSMFVLLISVWGLGVDLPICNLDLEQCRNGHRRWKAKKALVQQFYTLVYLDPYLLQRGNCSRNLGTCLDFVYYLLSCIRFFFFYWKFMCSLVLFLRIFVVKHVFFLIDSYFFLAHFSALFFVPFLSSRLPGYRQISFLQASFFPFWYCACLFRYYLSLFARF